MPRNRIAYLVLCVGLLISGLASRHFDTPISAVFGKYPGDTMWAMLAYCGFGFLFPRLPIWRIALFTAALSLIIEVLKLYHAPWIVALRASTFGYLVLGHIFSYENLLAYAIGIAMCVTCEWLAYRRTV